MFDTTPAGLLWGALFSVLLIAACVTDVRTRRIPNALVIVIVACGLGFSLATRPFPGSVGESLMGLGLGFAVWIGFWLAGVMGAGDVKFFAAIGTWLGPAMTWRAALTAALVGGILAVAMLVRSRTLRPAVRRIALGLSAGSLGVLGAQDAPGSRARRHLPYGVALALGSLLVAWFPTVIPW
jgi:prepilin peptidase CpaA